MKKIIKITAVIAMMVGVFASCKPDETAYMDTSAKPKVTFVTSSAATNVVEGDQEYVITANLEYALNESVTIYMFKTAGTADSNDYSVGTIIIPRGATTATGKITIAHDNIPEDQETLTVTIGDNRTTNATVIPASMSFVIDNYTSTDILLEFAWDKEVDVAGTTYDFTDIDFDFYVVDNTFALPGVGGYDAATGSSPEHMALSGLADGTYYIFANKYDAPWDIGPIKIPTRVNFTKPGTFITGDVTQSPNDQFISGDIGGYKYVTSFEVAGGVYTIYDAEGNVFYQE